MSKLWFCLIRRLLVIRQGKSPAPYSFKNLAIAQKNYSKIKTYCKNNRIKLRLSYFGTNSAGTVNGDYDISISNEQAPLDVIATALHELGHIIRWESLKKNGQGEAIEKLFLVQSALFMGRISEKGAELLYEEEEIAWTLGEKFAREMELNLAHGFTMLK